MSKERKKNPYILMAFMLILWGSFAAVSKWTLVGLESWQMQFYMFAIAMIFMLFLLPFYNHSKQFAQISRKKAIKLSLIGFISYLYYVSYTTALKFIPAIEASMLNYLFPIAIVLFALWLHKEKLSLAKWLLILSGFIGTCIIISNGALLDFRLTNGWGDLLAIGGAFLWGLFSILGRSNDAPLFVSCSSMLLSLLFCLSYLCSYFRNGYSQFGGCLLESAG
jgi:drug/metabolite transporter (DMT)-like permease